MYTSLLFPYTLDFFVSRLYPGQVYTQWHTPRPRQRL